jgi:hypothetical protein
MIVKLIREGEEIVKRGRNSKKQVETTKGEVLLLSNERKIVKKQPVKGKGKRSYYSTKTKKAKIEITEEIEEESDSEVETEEAEILKEISNEKKRQHAT